MTPWQSAKEWWDDHSTQDFWEAIGEHLSAGYVWNSPDCFILAKATRWNPEDQSFELGPPNCWFVTLAATAPGIHPVRECLRLAPHPHPFVAWCRRGTFEPHVYSMQQLTKKLGDK
jgi:hypothetical protein